MFSGRVYITLQFIANTLNIGNEMVNKCYSYKFVIYLSDSGCVRVQSCGISRLLIRRKMNPINNIASGLCMKEVAGGT